jgi:hypothetical protein
MHLQQQNLALPKCLVGKSTFHHDKKKKFGMTFEK